VEPQRRQGDPALNLPRAAFAAAAAALLAAALPVASCGRAAPGRPADPAAAAALVARGAGELRTFDFVAAERTLAAAIEADPGSYEARLDHAIAVLNQTTDGAQERAIGLLDGVLRDRPGDVRAEYCQALGYLFLGDPVRALPRFRRAAEAVPQDPYAAFYAGQCCELRGELDAARGFYRRAGELDPYLRSAALGLQRVAARAGDEAASAAALEEFRRLEGNPRGKLAEFKYTRMGPLGEAVLVPGPARAVVPPQGPPLAAIAPMPVDGMPPAPLVVTSIVPAADIDGDGTLEFVAQVEEPEEFRIERRFVRSMPGGRWRLDPATTDALRRGHAMWGDLDNDGRTDVAFGRRDAATSIIGGGIWPSWSQQQPDGSWRQHTFEGALLPHDDLACCADLDHDGDLDFVWTSPAGSGVLWNLARAGEREPIAWERREIAGALSGARAVPADLDRDGDLDLLLWSAKGAAAQAWSNDRLWAWRREPALAALEAAGPGAIVAFRRNEDGEPALATLVGGSPGAHGALQLWEREGAAWRAGVRTPVSSASALWVTDLAGSGHSNIVVREPEALVVLDAHGGPVDRIAGVPAGAELAAIDARGPVVVAPAAAAGEAPRWLGPGPGRWPYAALAVRGRTDPSQQMRTNASGIGTRLDARVAGEWVARDALPWRSGGHQALEPLLVGLGGAEAADFVAIDWPDAVTQAELAVGAGARTIAETQRQISSCPVIFAWDGARHRFITDCLGVGGIGYLAGIERRPDGALAPVYPPPRPWERVVIGGADALAPRDGAFDVRLGEPMEEACYLDAARLVAWDLPAGWNLALDERMGINGPAPTGEARFWRRSMVPAAQGPHGAALAARDGVAADLGPADPRFIGRLAGEGTVELRFPRAIDSEPGDPALLLDGWVEYPYSSTGFAMWQARAPYQAPTLEALDPATGAWVTLVAEYGYPAGMPRQCMLPVPRDLLPPGCAALRLRTTMEIYVDAARLAWLEQCPQAVRRESPLRSASVDAAGFAARVPRPQRRPDYDYARRAPLWDCRVQPGAYTRFGECTPLLAATDDAVAVFGAGEEVRLRFDATAVPPPSGDRSRTWVLEVDGWCKDMDLLTATGDTLMPMPVREGISPSAARDALHARFNDRWAGGR
jgi:tetratricopeptide (TPR) repeat protein